MNEAGSKKLEDAVRAATVYVDANKPKCGTHQNAQWGQRRDLMGLFLETGRDYGHAVDIGWRKPSGHACAARINCDDDPATVAAKLHALADFIAPLDKASGLVNKDVP